MRNCKLCSSDQLTAADSDVRDFEYGSSGTYTYWRCRQCGLLHIDPLPDESKLGEAYPETYHAYHEHQSRLARDLKRRYWRRKAWRYAQYVSRESSILELGCSFGDLLVAFRTLGCRNLKGLDFNSKAVEKARRRGVDVDQGELETHHFPPQSFQMIIMENFIEHVYDPIGTLRCCFSLLGDRGLVVGETPNVDSWDYRLFRRHWGGYHTPRHLYLFNTNNLALLAEKGGFRVRQIRNLLQPAHWALSLQNRLQDSPLKTRLRRGRSPYFTLLLLLALPINAMQILTSKTSSIEFVLEKK